jgi:hypothetical protein
MTVWIAGLMAAAGVCAQEPALEKPSERQPEKQPEKQPEPKPQPSLDDLLGIPKDKAKTKDGKAAPEQVDPTRNALDRKLSMDEAQEAFKQAVDMMGETATRIKDGRDTGLATQRLQEDIIRKLDMLISAAERQQQQKKSKSKKQQQPQQEQDQANQQQNNRQPHGKEAAPDTIDPPSAEAANPRPGTAARGALWGNLPERVRNALLQGHDETYSSLYRKWTEAYYKKLAEEANK